MRVVQCNGMRFFGCLFAATLLGCGEGPPRYDISGTATYDGKPIPIGAIVLNPDHQSGNSGPQGRAVIEDGEISIKDDMGTVAGAQWLQIMGSDGNSYRDHEGTLQQGKSLFEMVQQKIDLPKRDMELNIRIVPATGGDREPSVEVDILE